MALSLCLNGTGPLSCQNYITPGVPTIPAGQNPKYVYLGNFSGSPSVSMCTLDQTTGAIVPSSCQDAGGDSVLTAGSSGIFINKTKNIAYITNSGSIPSVFQCVLNANNGTFSSCSENPINTPGYLAIYGMIVLSADNQTAFFPDTHLSGQVIACPITNGVVGPTCAIEAATVGLGSFSAGITLNSAGNIVYVATGGPGVLVCDVTNNIFINCTTKTGDSINSFNYAAGVALNNTGNILYVTDNTSGNVYGCSPTSVNPSTLFDTCFIATNISGAYGITLNKTNTLAYLTSFGSNVFVCPILNDGTFDTCTQTTDVSFQNTTGITLGY